MENSNGKIGEKKAKGIIYDEMLEHLATIREKRSKEMGTQLPKISRSSLTRRTQRSMKLVKIFEKISIDKIKYLSAYSPNSISELANDQIQEIIDNSTKQDDFPTPEISAGNLETSEKILPEVNVSTTPKPAGVSVPTAPIPSNHDSAGPEVTKSLAVSLGTKSNSSSETSSGNTSKTEVNTSSSISSSKIGSSNRSRLPISILPEDPKEKRKHIIGLVLEHFPYLSFRKSDEYSDSFNLDNSASCLICNGDHKETAWKNIEGEWGSGEYYGE